LKDSNNNLENLAEDDSCCGKGCACENEAETLGSCCSPCTTDEKPKIQKQSGEKLRNYAYATLIAASVILASRIALRFLNLNK
jgi:hypothetical protein